MEYQEYKDYREYFENLIQKKEFKVLKEEITGLNVVDIAEIIEDLEDKNMILVFRMLPKEISAEVFSYMEIPNQLRIVNAITEPELKEIIDDLYFDDKIDFLEEVPANVVKRILKDIPHSERKLINEFLKYPEDSAGSMMTIEFIHFRPEMTVEDAMKHIKETGMDTETIYTCYVENEYKMLIGFISLRTLVVSDPKSLIKDIMVEDLITVNTLDDREDVADKFKKYGYIALPVVDSERRLCGIITFDDILEVVEDETTEDFHKMAAINPSEEEYLNQTPWQLAKNRIPWLLILMISATFTSGIINNFNYIVAQFIILNNFIPMITGTGGNSGSQASTTIIRALGTDEIGFGDFNKVVFREFLVGLMCGGALGFVNFLRLIFISKTAVNVSFLVSLTIVVTVTLSKCLGAALPMGAKKIGLDPAIMAQAVITTIIDSIVLIIYFSLASLILPIN